ncbi:MAG TPA: hypothetical protein VF914_00965 [Chloroflexia bacterium]
MGQSQPKTSHAQGFDAEYASVRSTVLQWSVELRTALVHELLDTIGRSEDASAQRVRTLDTALGLLRTDADAPSDEEVQSWLDEYKTEKYG